MTTTEVTTTGPSKPFRVLSADGPIEDRYIAKLFERLAAIFGARMAEVYGPDAKGKEVRAEWAQGLARFTGPEVMRGLEIARTKIHPPALGEFLQWCRPALDPEAGFIEAERGLRAFRLREPFDWSHPAVYGAAASMAFDIQSRPYREIRKRWEAELSAQFDRDTWAPIPDPTAHRIEHDTPAQREIDGVQARPDAVRERLQRVRQKLTGYPTKAAEEKARDEAIAAERERDRRERAQGVGA